jgi:hypothetical protein
MTQLDTNGYYALGIPAYALLIGVEVYFTRAKGLDEGFHHSVDPGLLRV